MSLGTASNITISVGPIVIGQLMQNEWIWVMRLSIPLGLPQTKKKFWRIGKVEKIDVAFRKKIDKKFYKPKNPIPNFFWYAISEKKKYKNHIQKKIDGLFEKN